MPSVQSRDIDELYRWYRATADAMIEKSIATNTPLSMADFRKISFFTLTREPSAVRYTLVDADGVPGIWVDPEGGAKDKVMLYFHGGAYVHETADTYKWFCGHVANTAGCRVLIVDYRLAPENPFPAQIEDAIVAYSWLLDQGYRSEDLALAGDSAGGGLALALLLAIKKSGESLPVGAVSMSGWLDLTGSNPLLKSRESVDLLVTQKGSVENSAIVLAGADPKDPLASPIFGDFTGIETNIYLQVGGSEGLLGENMDMVVRLGQQGVHVTLEVFPQMQHFFQQGAGYIPESNAALQKIGAFLKPLLKL